MGAPRRDVTRARAPAPPPVETEAIARGLMEASPDALVVVDGRGQIVFANQRCEEMFGYRREELLGSPVEILVPERYRARHVRQRESFLAAPHARQMGADVGLVGQRRDGSEVPVEVTLAPVSTERGPLVVASVRDVSERAATLRALRESEERFRHTFEEAPSGMALVGMDGRFLRVNPSLSAIVGYSQEELTKRTFKDITHPDDVDIDAALAGALGRGEIPSYQLAKRYVKKDGTIVHVMLSGSIVRDAQGKPLHFIAQVEDITARLAAEDAHRTSVARTRELFEQAPEAIFIADLEGRYTEVNDAACRMLGYTRQELLGKTIADIIPPEDLPRLNDARETLRSGDRVQVAEWTLRRKDGTSLPVEVSAKVHRDGRWVAFVRDLSETRRNEMALRRSEEALTRAQRVANLGSWEWDLATNQVVRSNQMFALFGLAPGAAPPIRWSLSEYVHPDDRELVARVVNEAVQEQRAYSLEHRIIRSDGVERIVVQQGEPIFEGGRATHMVGTLLDVTERRRAQTARDATLRWLRQVVESSPIGLLLLHARDLPRVEINARAEAIFGQRFERVDQERLLGMQGEYVPVESYPGLRALRGERTEGSEYLVQRPDGTTLPVLVSAAPVLDAHGNPEGAVVAVLDITPAKELERLRAEWSSVVAHDLRQPLNTMMLYVQVLVKNAGDAEVRHSLLEIKAAGMRLHRMVDDLMDLSRLEARRLELARQRLDVRALAQASVERALLGNPPNAIELRAEVAPLEANVDPDRIAQVLDNLLSNAVKYGERETPIFVDVRRDGDRVAIEVTNRGRGIPPAEIPRLFQRFQRTEGARATRVKGVGLGLYITRELVEAHGGQLTVTSTPGETTTFRVTLPTERSS